MVGSVERAEELVQDAFVAMMKRAQAHGLPDNPAAYLRTSVVNASRAEFRHRDVVRKVEPILRSAARTSGEDAIDTLADAVFALPARQRAAEGLRYYCDFSEVQIADALGVARGTVKALLHQGIANLRG